MDVIVRKNDNNIYINNMLLKDKEYCYVIGNIYNIDDLCNEKKSIEEKIIKLYKKYNDELFIKLNGEYAIIIVINNEIKAIRDRLGTKLLYYGVVNDEFFVTDNLKLCINEYKKHLEIDKNMLACYIKKSYINEPNTIFKDIYKVKSGNYISYDDSININVYYDLVSNYLSNKSSINDYEEAYNKVEEGLIKSIELRTKASKKVNVYFSAGIDSTFIASLLGKLKKDVHTYTIGFYEKEKNEAEDAKKIAKYLKTKHNEYYFNSDKIMEVVKLIPKIYSEPFADPSLIPIIYLGEKVDKKNITLVGDAADQLYCGSDVYDNYNVRKALFNFRIYLQKVIKTGVTTREKYVLDYKYKEKKNKYVSNKQINYMLNDIKSFYSNRLNIKEYYPYKYYGLNIGVPFIDNDFIDTTFSLNHKFKYNNKNRKYILKEILFNYIPRDYLNKSKKGFGIPLSDWLYTVFYKDFDIYFDENIIKKQGLFNYKKINRLMKYFNDNDLNRDRETVIFNLYLFQLWYQEYIEDLW